MDSGAGGKNSQRVPNYFLRRLLVAIILLGTVALFVYNPTREFVKTPVFHNRSPFSLSRSRTSRYPPKPPVRNRFTRLMVAVLAPVLSAIRV
jgi:hypothetical protein